MQALTKYNMHVLNTYVSCVAACLPVCTAGETGFERGWSARMERTHKRVNVHLAVPSGPSDHHYSGFISTVYAPPVCVCVECGTSMPFPLVV